MEPQKNAQQPADQNSTNWNDEAPKPEAGTPEVEVALNGVEAATSTPPAPAENTVGGPDSPSITSEAASPVVPAEASSAPAEGDGLDQASGVQQPAPQPDTSGMPMQGAAPDASQPNSGQTPVSPADASQPAVPAEPAAHHPSSLIVLLIVLVAVAVAALGFFVVPALF